jgi:CheY-like chemotaxis protein
LSEDDLIILHVEDDPLLVQVVKASFERFGFRGEMLSAPSVHEAVRVLNEMMLNRRTVSLIITDMQLIDGTGLDLIREVKSDPAWRMTPVIVLSHEVREGIVNDAYALGAGCYVPKAQVLNGSLHDVYRFWLESAKLPGQEPRDRAQEALERSVGFRTRIARLYLRLAKALSGSHEEEAFWLNRALDEGNLSNLLTFFENRVSEERMPKDLLDRLTSMQIKVRDSLKSAEESLYGFRRPSPELACRIALDLADAVDEEIFAELLGVLFPQSSVATAALKARASSYLRDLATHVPAVTTDVQLRRKADELLEWSRRIGGV